MFCPSLFGQQSLINLNKNSPLLTDGNNLYYLGSRIRISKGDHDKKDVEDNKEKVEEKKEQNNMSDRKKKRPKKNDPQPQPQNEENKNQNYQKVLEIVLY